tara:strand:- start:95 stop:1120 length:1026 start_codon:yes stop_codon:yes gene_type:complete
MDDGEKSSLERAQAHNKDKLKQVWDDWDNVLDGFRGRKLLAIDSSNGSTSHWQTFDPNNFGFTDGLLLGWVGQTDWHDQPFTSHTPSIGRSGDIFLFDKGRHHGRDAFWRHDHSAGLVHRADNTNDDSKTKWYYSFPSDTAFVSPCSIDENNTIYISTQGHTYALDGQVAFGPDQLVPAIQMEYLLKSRYLSGGSIHIQPILGYDNKIYVGGSIDRIPKDGTSREAIICLDRKTGEKIWEFALDFGGPFYTPALSSDNTLYVTAGLDGKFLYALNAETGEKKWEYEIGPSLASPLIGNDGTIYIGSKMGFYAIRGDSGPANTAWPMYKQNQQRTGRAPKAN